MLFLPGAEGFKNLMLYDAGFQGLGLIVWGIA